MKCRAKYSAFTKAFFSALIVIMTTIPLAAAELQSATIQAWTGYVEATERRIASELKSAKGFLVLDFQSAAEAQRERLAVLAGEIPVRKMETADSGGRQIQVESAKSCSRGRPKSSECRCKGKEKLFARL